MALRFQSVSTRTASLVSCFPSSKRCVRRSPRVSLGTKRDGSFNRLVVRAGKEVQVDLKEAGVVRGDILPSGEWAENFSLLNYEDLTKHYEPALFKPEVGTPVVSVLTCIGMQQLEISVGVSFAD